MFERLKDKLRSWRQKAAQDVAPDEIVGETGRKVRERKLEDVLADLEVGLLEADVALPVVQAILATMREDLLGKRITREVSFGEGVELALRHAIEKVLSAEQIDFLELVKKSPRP